MPSEQEQGVGLPPCPFCAGVAVRKPDPGVVYELFGLVVDHKPGCFLALAGAEPDAIVDAAWNTRPTPDKALMPEAAVGEALAWADRATEQGIGCRVLTGNASMHAGYIFTLANAVRRTTTPMPVEEPEKGATVYETDDRGLFCKHCGRSALRHHPIKGIGLQCEPPAVTNAGQVEGGGASTRGLHQQHDARARHLLSRTVQAR